MKNRKLFFVILTTGERTWGDVAYYDSLAEAEADIMQYADWYSENGTCSIEERTGAKVLKRYRYFSGKLTIDAENYLTFRKEIRRHIPEVIPDEDEIKNCIKFLTERRKMYDLCKKIRSE